MFRFRFRFIDKVLLITVVTVSGVICCVSSQPKNSSTDVSTSNSYYTETEPKAPKKDIYYLNQGNEYILDGLFREAIDSYKKALSINSSNHLARRNMGIAQLKSKLYSKAQKNLQSIEKYYDSDFDTHYFLGEANRACSNYSQAIFQYQKALSIRPNDPRVLKSLSWSYYNIKYYSEALNTAKTLYRLTPKDSQVIIILSRIFLKTSKPDMALKLIEKAKSTTSEENIPFYLSVEGDIYSSMKLYPLAIKTYKKALATQPLLPGALLGIGECMLLTGQDRIKAINYIERSLRIRPDTTEAYYILGKAYSTIDKDKSKKYYSKFKQKAAKDPEFIAKLSDLEEEGIIHSNGTNKSKHTNTKKHQKHIEID